MQITAHEAMIHTASVEIQTLTISGKQVTLSVFRQLLNEPLIDLELGCLRGKPWGRINYFFGDCNDDHLHVVWQKDNELRRSCIFRRPPDRATKTQRQHLEALASVWVHQSILGGRKFGRNPFAIPGINKQGNPESTFRLTSKSDTDHSFVRREKKVPIMIGDFACDVHLSTGAIELMYPGPSQGLNAKNEVRCYLQILTSDIGQDSVESQANALIAEIADRNDRWLNSYNTIAATDQLFIAV